MRPWEPYARIASLLPPDLRAHAPRRWERLGDALLLKVPRAAWDRRAELAAAYAEVLGARTVVHDRGVRGAWREPDVEVLLGPDTETTHVEDGVRFRMDVARVMFSSGNLAERMRMGRAVRPGETVVDLFAGIGYYALPMAVHGRPARVVACEVNPTAFRYLEENVRLNRAGCVEPRLGDCRDVAPAGVADRIVLGYLRGRAYLDVAFRAARDEAVLHYHVAGPADGLAAEGDVLDAADRAGFRAEVVGTTRIKSVAPRVAHLVLDVRLVRGTRRTA